MPASRPPHRLLAHKGRGTMSINSNPHKEHTQMLFDKNLGIANNQLELGKLLKQYPSSEYDPLYVCLASRVDLTEDKMLLRLMNGLDKKSGVKGYCKYVKQGVVRIDDPYIIAINRSKLEHVDPQVPLILKCLFGLGDQALFTEPEKSDLKGKGSY